MKMNQHYGIEIDALGTAKFFRQFDKKKESNIALDLVLPYCTTLQQLDAIGFIYAENRNFIRSLEVAYKVLALAENPDQELTCRVNVIRSLLNTNQPNKALEHINVIKELYPNDQPNLMDEAYVLFLLNRKDEAESILREILKNPTSEDIYNRCTFNIGSYDLRNGNFKSGISNFLLSGRKMNIWKNITLPNTYWDGRVVKGAVIVFLAEGGIGDEIINIRFHKHIKDLGMIPVWYTDRKDLADVFIRNGFDCITDLKEVKPDWWWSYSMLLPVFLDLDEKDLWYGKYLEPKLKLPNTNIKKIGIKISGNPEYDQDLARTVDLDGLLECIPEDYEVYSFHYEEPIDHPRVINWMNKDVTWDDTLNVINNMDIIVSSCTSLIHACGAMDKEAIVMTPILKYYLWSNEKRTSPWYSDKITVLHQHKNNNWSDVFKELKELL